MDNVDVFYNFYAEFPPQELGFHVYVYFADEVNLYYKKTLFLFFLLFRTLIFFLFKSIRMERNLEASVMMEQLQLLIQKFPFLIYNCKLIQGSMIFFYVIRELIYICFLFISIFMYFILIGFFGGIGYLIFQTFFGGAKTKKSKKVI
jgi:hypothetical protein